jgi:hypothetical protein
VTRILVLGSYGTVKTTFINALTRSTKYCRSTNVAVVQSYLHGYRDEVDVIDIPGWGDQYKTDYEVLKMIQSFLSEENIAGRRLHCVVYMINIGETRLGSTHRRWINVLEELVGPKALQSITELFTHGLRESRGDRNADLGFQRQIQDENERIDAWKQILPPGAKTWRFILIGEPELDDLEKKSGKRLMCLRDATGSHTNFRSPSKNVPHSADVSDGDLKMPTGDGGRE